METQNFIQQLKEGYEGSCPCCHRYAKIYRRRIHTSVALQLIALYKKEGHKEWVHASELISPGVTGMGDLGKAKYWNLIKPKPHEIDDKKSSGFWKLTETGLGFVEQEIEIKKFALVFDDKVIGLEGEFVNILQCLGNKFNYTELMG